MKRKLDVANIFICIISVIILLGDNFMIISESRVGKKIGISAMDSLGSNYIPLVVMTVVIVVMVLIKGENEKLNFITGLVASLNFGMAVLFAGQSTNVIESTTTNFRISMGLGFYSFLVCMYALEIKCNQFIKKEWKRSLVIGLGLLLSVLWIKTGQLDGLSIMIEYYSRESQFHKELLNHIKISLSVVVSGAAIGIPLGWIAFKKEKLGKWITSILNIIESVPSLALICALMLPLALLSNAFVFLRKIGVSGVGATPVFCALLFYSLFQIVHSMYGALKIIDKQYIESAKAMGMSGTSVFTKVELPIILPILVSGIRVSLIQTISGATVGAYAGFGGLGMFILSGNSGFAIDLILLGTIPIMGLIFIFDFSLKLVVDVSEVIRKRKGMVKV